MCGRFALKTPIPSLRETFLFDNTPDCRQRYNIAPAQQVLVVRLDQGRRIAEMMLWGLIPPWAESRMTDRRIINARAESVEGKPAFRQAFRQRRCVIPADGFYEWWKTSKGKQPHFIRRADGRSMALAGLWESSATPDGDERRSCTIITVPAVVGVAHIHDRMPAILSGPDVEAWLDPTATATALKALLQPDESIDLDAYPVKRKVNTPENDSPDCIEPLAQPDTPSPGLF